MMKRDTGPFFLVFWAHSEAVSRFIKNDEEGHRASFLVFWAHSKAVSRFIKNDEEGHRASFLVFWAHSEAVSLNIKNDEEGQPGLFFSFLGAFRSGVTFWPGRIAFSHGFALKKCYYSRVYMYVRPGVIARFARFLHCLILARPGFA